MWSAVVYMEANYKHKCVFDNQSLHATYESQQNLKEVDRRMIPAETDLRLLIFNS